MYTGQVTAPANGATYSGTSGISRNKGVNTAIAPLLAATTLSNNIADVSGKGSSLDVSA